jgi:hypothetical protein
MSLQSIWAITGHDRKTIRKYLGKEPETVPTYAGAAAEQTGPAQAVCGEAAEGGRVERGGAAARAARGRRAPLLIVKVGSFRPEMWGVLDRS